MLSDSSAKLCELTKLLSQILPFVFRWKAVVWGDEKILCKLLCPLSKQSVQKSSKSSLSSSHSPSYFKELIVVSFSIHLSCVFLNISCFFSCITRGLWVKAKIDASLFLLHKQSSSISDFPFPDISLD